MALETAQLLNIYRKMATIRAFNHRAAAESLARNIPAAIRPYVGEEASSVGACAALTDDDRITSTHRRHGHAIAKGMDIRLMLAELFGRSNGSCHGKGGTMHLADFSRGMLGANGIVGGGLPVATGAAMAAQMEGQGKVAVAFFGDGASSEGSFHGCLNLAAIWKLPIIYFCENNGWALGVPATYSLSVEDIAVRAVSYDMPGITVDGTDALAVYEVMEQAVARARRGEGPTLIEAKTYRWNTDTPETENPQANASPNGAEESYRGNLKDPLVYFGQQLAQQGIVTAAEVAASLDDAVAFALASPFPRPEDALTEVFAV